MHFQIVQQFVLVHDDHGVLVTSLLIPYVVLNWVYSIQNWVEDLYWKQLDIDYPGVDNAMVRTTKFCDWMSLP